MVGRLSRHGEAATGESDVVTHEGAAARARRWVRPTAWALGVVGLLAIGATGAQLLLPRTVVAGAEPAPAEASVGSPPTEAAALMPNVLGLDEATSRRVLADAGVTAAVMTDREPAAGPPGVVTAQKPQPGDGAGDAVVLTLSEPVTVPDDIAGSAADDARATLEALGAVVRVTRSVDPARPEGVVLSTDPPAGRPLGSVIELVVADPGQAVSLSELRRLESAGCSKISGGTVNGRSVEDSITCTDRASAEELATSEWILARQGVALEATVGMLDRAEQGSGALRILGDGSVLSETVVGYGTAEAIRVDVRGVLRLRVEFESSSGQPTAVLGDARVLGTEQQVAAILDAQ